MIINASVRMGSSADKKTCDDSLLFTSLSPAGISNLLSWNSRLACEIPGDIQFIAAVADGVGGSPAGNVASRFVLSHIAALSPPAGTGPEWLAGELRQINADLLRYGSSDKDLSGMATTVSGVMALYGKALLFHVGDSRVYVPDGRFLRQLTLDHTLTQGRSPADNKLLACMGGGDSSNINMLRVEEVQLPGTGSGIVLTTDGIHDSMETDDIKTALKQYPDGQGFCEHLTNLALRNGSYDDLSVMLIVM